jgi:hypothetical protein
MKSTAEKRMCDSRDAANELLAVEHGDAALEVLYSFSELECFADVKLEAGWVRYALMENGDDEACELRRIG